ncbi:hypothetical protein TIFTF001_021002 [Ficus carica]|uniref:Uncharacterized protein n=1 Tax=Ficus carica TaxID=3494 RepID=A0AA88AEV9_FICCA|nr:hypothetical protein TIFTF001_021002 [Ficus carica]
MDFDRQQIGATWRAQAPNLNTPAKFPGGFDGEFNHDKIIIAPKRPKRERGSEGTKEGTGGFEGTEEGTDEKFRIQDDLENKENPKALRKGLVKNSGRPPGCRYDLENKEYPEMHK